MGKIVIGIIIAVVIVGGLIYAQKNFNRVREPAGRPAETGTEHIITKTDSGFSSAAITVKLGDKVIFKNQSSKSFWPASNLHPTHTIYSEFDSLKGVPAGESYSFVFEKVGKWPYHDHLDSTQGGVITVEN